MDVCFDDAEISSEKKLVAGIFVKKCLGKMIYIFPGLNVVKVYLYCNIWNLNLH